MLRRVSILFAGLLLTTCAPLFERAGQDAPPTPRPALWKLSDADTTIWLFGTIHVLPADYHWIDSALETVIAGADRLTMETVLEKDGEAAAGSLLMTMGSGTEGLPPLAERVPEDKRATLTTMIARTKLPPAFLDTLETWTAALMLVGVTIADLGLSADHGAEEQLEARFRTAGKPVDGLETPAEQLGYFDSLPEAEQRLFLATMLEDAGKARTDFDAMLAAWAKGDEAAIAATFDEEFEASPVLRETLLRGRNARWADQLKARLEAPGTSFVAVGAAHLAGPDSVQALLTAKGVTVERVR